MSDYGQVTRSHTFQGFAKFVFWLHTARTENPETLLTHLSASNFHEYYSQHSQTPPTQPHILKQHLSVSGGVCLHLLVSADMSCSLEQSGGCLGAVWVVSGSVLSVSHGNWRRWDVWGVSGLSVFQYGAKIQIWQNPERCDFLSPGHNQT